MGKVELTTKQLKEIKAAINDSYYWTDLRLEFKNAPYGLGREWRFIKTIGIDRQLKQAEQKGYQRRIEEEKIAIPALITQHTNLDKQVE